MKRTREKAKEKENNNTKRQTTLGSFVIKPKFPTYFHLHHSTKDNTFNATFSNVNPCSGAAHTFQAKIHWPERDIQFVLSTNIRNGTFEDQDTWQQKCKYLSSSIPSKDKKHYEMLELRFLTGVEDHDTSAVISSAAAMACFERDWSGSTVNGLKRLLQVISSLNFDKEYQKHYPVLVWLQCAEAKGFMITPDCLDYLLSYVENVTQESNKQAEPSEKSNNAKVIGQTKPTLDRILLVKDKSVEVQDLLLAMYIRSEYLSDRQGNVFSLFTPVKY